LKTGNKLILISLFCGLSLTATAQQVLIPMDLRQTDHLKAYGIAYRCLAEQQKIYWLLNFRGGSFLLPAAQSILRQCKLRGVQAELIDAAAYRHILQQIEQNNMESILLEKAPEIAIYAPPNNQPWDDAVTLALTYAEIPYTTIWDEEVLKGVLDKYDWLHLHHEDFTGQYGKFYGTYRKADWYVQQKSMMETRARQLGFNKVSKLKLAVALNIRRYIERGGFLFAMCSAADTYDIALAAENTDICAEMFDGDPQAADFAAALNFDNCLAFENFKIESDPLVYEYSNIDTTPKKRQAADGRTDYFTLFEFSAKYDPVPAMLTQNHVSVIHNFMGQTTGFHADIIKPAVLVMARQEGSGDVKYIHGKAGKGTFTFLGGHDPEDYQHFVGDQPTDLSLHKNSPGYRLILNNILFPAARKKKQKTRP